MDYARVAEAWLEVLDEAVASRGCERVSRRTELAREKPVDTAVGGEPLGQAHPRPHPGTLRQLPPPNLYPFAACGADDLLMEGLWVEYPERLSIGDHVNVNRDCWIGAGGGVTIGDWVLIGPRVMIFSQNHVFDGVDVPIALSADQLAPVTIENDAWIGAAPSSCRGSR